MSENVQVIPAVRHEVLVKADPTRAFEVFTAGFGTWWPREHTISTVPVKGPVIEARAGGACYDECEDGGTCPWGTVLEFEPPHRLVLAWQITGAWQYEPDVEKASRVTVTFVPNDDGTLVTLVHDEFERHGSGGAAVAAGVGGANGWPRCLDLFTDALA